MSKLFYPKLAASNLQKNARLYLPYLLTCIGTVMMFYNMMFVASSKGLREMPGAAALTSMMFFGVIIIGIFAVIFLMYTNSFLIKQRKKELGLYGILGMEKRHISRVLFFETVYTAVISILVGLILGVLFSQLSLMLLCKILEVPSPLRMEVSVPAILASILLFCGIFLMIMISNQTQIRFSKPVELLRGGNTGEREPKTRWLMAVVGAVFLCAGYAISIFVKTPMEALALFFVAVILVIFGTYLLFTAGSIALLKLLRRNKDYYYGSTNHFTSVSGMLHRMKQNAVGLANICILSTMVLVMLTGTITLYSGSEDSLNSQFPNDISLTTYQDIPEALDIMLRLSDETASEYGLEISDRVAYTHLSVSFMKEGNRYTSSRDASSSNIVILAFMTAENYERNGGEHIDLADGEVALCTDEDMPYSTIEILGKTFTLKKVLSKEPIGNIFDSMSLNNSALLVTDNDMQAIDQLQQELYDPFPSEIRSSMRFNLSGDDDDLKIAYNNALKEKISNEIGGSISSSCKAENRQDYYGLYGGFIFLGVFLGLLFTMAAVLIVYYKQISEGYVDRERFFIMQKVGMSANEVKTSIRGQILTVFFLPLTVAVAHLLFASPILNRMLLLFGLTNFWQYALIAGVTTLCFALIYCAVYAITARSYYKIVRFGE